jgi:predicted enzyme related to lactoylglutathione lyase
MAALDGVRSRRQAMADTSTAVIGAPGWADLSSTDAEASRKFYSALFGWAADVIADPNAGGYGMFTLNGRQVAGVGPTQDPNQPTAWLPYVLVSDAAALTRSAKAAGGTVVVEPMDVMGEGTMGIIVDPSGATFGIWQPGRHQGFELKEVPGSYCWAELSSRKRVPAEAFYKDVFGWTPEHDDALNYTVFKLDGNMIAGAMDTPEMVPQEVPSYWMVYFAVDSADAVAARAKELGAHELVPPTDIPNIGRFAVILDPQGATFGILQAPPQPH